MERLKRYNELDVRERKMDMYVAGEELFALRTSKYPEDTRQRRKVGCWINSTAYTWMSSNRVEVNQSTLWIDVPGRLQEMTEEANGFDLRCKKMPKRLRDWKISTKISES